jgi:hypothetical protein
VAKSLGDVATRRYKDAYLVANSVVGFGSTIKAVGVVLALLIAIVGFVAAESLGTAAGVACGLVGLVMGAVIYIFGVLIAAQGQLHYAILDVAVNTSPVLPDEAKTNLIANPSAAAVGDTDAQPTYRERNYQPEDAPGGKIKCWKCGKTNWPTQDKCWDCYTPLFDKP